MHLRRPTNGTILGGAALFIALGGTAFAATGTLVNIADSTNSARVAHVDANGKLLVGDGSGPLSVDGTVNAPTASPSTFWRASGGGNSGCDVVAVPPAGKAVVVRQLNVNLFDAPTGSLSADHFIAVYNNSTCAGAPVWDETPVALGVTSAALDPGVGIPASGALSVIDFNDAGYAFELYATGYLVPAGAVPAGAAPTRTAPRTGAPSAVR